VIGRSWPWPEEVQFVIGTPAAEVETAASRKSLPLTIERPDAVFNLQRALLLLNALQFRRYEDLREAFRDRWHQPVRMGGVPGLEEALTLDHPAVLGACLSGSGPSIALFTRDRQQPEAAALLADIYQRLGVPYTIRELSAHQPARELSGTL
jgi:homoserine kinase